MEMMETIEIHFCLHPAIIPWYLGVPVSARCRAISVTVATSRDSESIMRPGVNINTVNCKIVAPSPPHSVSTRVDIVHSLSSIRS